MVIPQLRRILVSNEPHSENDFVVPAIADIGPLGSEGVDYFYFRIMSPNKLISILNEDKVMDGKAVFFVDKFNLELIEIEIKNILNECIRPTWDEVANAINRHLNWEYDNVHYETHEEAMKRLDNNT